MAKGMPMTRKEEKMKRDEEMRKPVPRRASKSRAVRVNKVRGG